MNIKYSPEIKQQSVDLYHSGKSVAAISKQLGVSRSSLYKWLNEQKQDNSDSQIIRISDYNTLKRQNERYKTIIEILKTVKCTVSDPLQIKLVELEKIYGKYSSYILSEALEVPRSTLYNHINNNKRSNSSYAVRREKLSEIIREIYDENNQIFGAAKIRAIMKDRGIRISVEMVRELMCQLGLISIRQSAKKMYESDLIKYKNRVNQNFQTDAPNQVWVSDITYYNFKGRFLYICAIIDLFSRMVISFKIGNKNSTQLVRSTFKQAFESRKPANLIFHTDRGSNYRSKTMCDYLKSLNVTQSFSQAHNPYDNSVMESFFASLKKEELYRRKYRSETELRESVAEYMIFYNTKRPHASLQYKTPQQKEDEFIDK